MTEIAVTAISTRKRLPGHVMVGAVVLNRDLDARVQDLVLVDEVDRQEWHECQGDPCDGDRKRATASNQRHTRVRAKRSGYVKAVLHKRVVEATTPPGPSIQLGRANMDVGFNSPGRGERRQGQPVSSIVQRSDLGET